MGAATEADKKSFEATATTRIYCWLAALRNAYALQSVM